MPAPRRFDLEDILNRPGTYFNPETEVLLVVDDAPELDADLFEDDSDGGDWVLLVVLRRGARRAGVVAHLEALDHLVA